MAALCDEALSEAKAMPDSSNTCVGCGEDVENHVFTHIRLIGDTVDYVIPSFPVFEVKLRHVKFILDNKGTIYDGYVHTKDAGTLKEDSILRLCSGYSNAFFIECDEFHRSVDISNLNLLDDNTKVFVFWKWHLTDCEESEDVSFESETEEGKESDYEATQTSEEEQVGSASTTSVYSVTFKCIGSTKEQRYQETLALVAEENRKGVTVEVRIIPETQNPFDARVIAFECFVNKKWERIGYMVTDVLNSVHQALKNKEIVSTDFEWVKFITHWSRCTPGWYCGIKVSKKGPWNNEVIRCRSTI